MPAKQAPRRTHVTQASYTLSQLRTFSHAHVQRLFFLTEGLKLEYFFLFVLICVVCLCVCG